MLAENPMGGHGTVALGVKRLRGRGDINFGFAGFGELEFKVVTLSPQGDHLETFKAPVSQVLESAL